MLLHFQNWFKEKGRFWLGWRQGSHLSRALAELITCGPSVCGEEFTFSRLEPDFRRWDQKHQCESESTIRLKKKKVIMALNGC